MTKEEVKKLFEEGIQMFESGQPSPQGTRTSLADEDRIRQLGWRHAKNAKLTLEMNLEAAYEAYVEDERKYH